MTSVPENKVLAAPLAGVSDSVYRRWARRFGAGMVFTEMVSAEGLRRGDRKTESMLSFEDEERPIGVQLFDDSPDAIADAAQIAQDRGFDIIDINLGCPARKVVRKGAGARLLRNPERAARLVETAIEAVNISVSVKMRSGWDEPEEIYLELIPILADIGVDFITLHPRTRESMFRGKSDWNKIRLAVKVSKVPVVGNGDIRTGRDAKRMLDETGCSGVMIGRASLGYPWIFREVSDAISGRITDNRPSEEERLRVCEDYIRELIDFYGERKGIFLARKHIIWFTKGLPGAKIIRERVFNARNSSEVFGILDQRKAESVAG